MTRATLTALIVAVLGLSSAAQGPSMVYTDLFTGVDSSASGTFDLVVNHLFQVDITANPLEVVVVVAGPTAADPANPVVIGGLPLGIDPAGAFVVFDGFTQGGLVDLSGHFILQAPVPDLPPGLSLFVQAYLVDLSSFAVTATNVVEMTFAGEPLTVIAQGSQTDHPQGAFLTPTGFVFTDAVSWSGFSRNPSTSCTGTLPVSGCRSPTST